MLVNLEEGIPDTAFLHCIKLTLLTLPSPISPRLLYSRNRPFHLPCIQSFYHWQNIKHGKQQNAAQVFKYLLKTSVSKPAKPATSQQNRSR